MALRLLLGVLALTQFGCSGFSKKASWGASAKPRVFSVQNIWSTQNNQADNLGFRKINRFTPVLYKSKKFGDMLIQANALDGVTAYDRLSGKILWRLSVLNGVEGSATMAGSFLFFGANDGQFYSVDAESGQVLWTFPTRIENLSEPTVDNGVVYFLSGSNTLYALDASSGQQLWLYSRADTSSLSVRGGSKPAVKNGVAYVGFSDGAVVALVAKTGQIKWEKQLSRNKKFRDIDCNPVVDAEFLYILGFDDATYALRSATGELVWKYEKGGYGGLLMMGDRLYYGSTSNELIALDKTTGRLVWLKPIKEGIATQPANLKGILVYGESLGSLRFLEASSGKELGHFEPGRGILSSPAVSESDNRVYFISNESNLYGVEAKWSSEPLFPYLR